MRRILLVFLVTRALLFGVTLIPSLIPSMVPPCLEFLDYTNEGVAVSKATPWHVSATGERYFACENRWIDSFVRMDSQHYLKVAIAGYGKSPGDTSENGFFPGFPYAVRWAARLGNALYGNGFVAVDVTTSEGIRIGLIAALVVSQSALLLAALALRRLAGRFLDPDRAVIAACCMLVSPFAFFGSAVLSESLFLWLTIESLDAGFAHRFLRAGVFGALAAFTRPVGVLLVLPLFIAALNRREGWRRVVCDCASIALVAAGLLLVFWIQRQEAGDPWAFIHTQQAGGFAHARSPTLAGLLQLFHPPAGDQVFLARNVAQLITIGVALFACVPLVIGAVRRRVSWALPAWAAASLAMPILADNLVSLPRYSLAVAPLFLGVAMLVPRGRPAVALAVVSVALQVAGFMLFAQAWPILV